MAIRLPQLKIRIDSVDTPESGQPFGKRAKQALSESLFGKVVTVQKTGEDRYKRTLAFIQLDGKDVSTAMVKNGFAWEYEQYSKSATLSKLQAAAKVERKGLWADPNPVPPWKWRKKSK